MLGLLMLMLLSTPVPRAAADSLDDGDLLDLSLEELSAIEITSASRRPQRLADAVASIYVIRGEDIRRAGARTLPEALRLAPNLQVARVRASTYAISSRGFNNSLGNKLQVLIDGRIVYTPLFSGVFWDAQDVLLEDVERIEVISGPRAVMWGANAVNGVINVITRPADPEHGGLVSLGGGDDVDGLAVRQGFRAGPLDWRVYAKAARVGHTESASGSTIDDGWQHEQAGFRGDRTADDARFTIQGDAYRGESSTGSTSDTEISGFNLLSRWQRTLASGGTFEAQAWFDRTEREQPLTFRDRINMAELGVQHATSLGRHAVVWGASYRHADDRVIPSVLVTFIPQSRDLDWFDLFVRDQIELSPRVDATLGLRLGSNPYTGVEVMPSAGLSFKPGEQHLIWGHLARAVRAPSRIDREFFFPGSPPFLIRGGPEFRSEVARVVEIGYRGSGSRSQLSLTAFHHDYDDLRSGQPAASGGGFFVENNNEGEVWGLEGWATLELTPGWTLDLGFVELRKDLRQSAGGMDPQGTNDLGNDPESQWQLRSTWRHGRSTLHAAVRHVDALPQPRIAAYTVADLRWQWDFSTRTSVAIAAANLFDDEHAEFAAGGNNPNSAFGRHLHLELRHDW